MQISTRVTFAVYETSAAGVLDFVTMDTQYQPSTYGVLTGVNIKSTKERSTNIVLFPCYSCCVTFSVFRERESEDPVKQNCISIHTVCFSLFQTIRDLLEGRIRQRGIVG